MTGCVCFDLSYGGTDILTVQDNKTHAVFQKRNLFKHNGLLEEFDAAKEWGHQDPDTYFLLPRETRAAMVGHMRLKRAISSMSDYDQSKKMQT